MKKSLPMWRFCVNRSVCSQSVQKVPNASILDGSQEGNAHSYHVSSCSLLHKYLQLSEDFSVIYMKVVKVQRGQICEEQTRLPSKPRGLSDWKYIRERPSLFQSYSSHFFSREKQPCLESVWK